MKITFAIIDHKQLQCQCLHLLIEACEDFEVLIKTYGIIEFKQMVANLGYCPKVVLLDLLLYRNNGVAIITWIKENYPGSRIITLGNEANYYPLYFLFEAGSNAYLGMDLEVEQFYQAIRNIIMDNFSHQSDNCIDRNSFLQARIFRDLKVFHFKEKQMDYIEMVVAGLHNKEIAKIMHISESAVDIQIGELYELTDIHNRPVFIHACEEMGFAPRQGHR